MYIQVSRGGEEVWLTLANVFSSTVLGMSGVTGAVLRETSFINRSLSALADVLGAISEQRSHIPYRNSKLTHLLQDSIGDYSSRYHNKLNSSFPQFFHVLKEKYSVCGIFHIALETFY